MKEIILNNEGLSSESALSDVFWALSFLTDGNDYEVQVVMDSEVCHIISDKFDE